MMDTKKLLEAKKKFQERIKSLENDAKRAYYPIEGVGFAPFPIIMYVIATVDYFSSYWAGWNQKRSKVDNQTKRIADFLERYLIYPQKEAQIAINIWRHKLMHTGQPRLLRERNIYYSWLIADCISSHMQLKQIENNNYELHIGVFNFIADLKEGIFGAKGYFSDLRDQKKLQGKFIKFEKEVSNYSFNPV